MRHLINAPSNRRIATSADITSASTPTTSRPRIRVVGIFTNEAAVERLVGAVLLENNEEWQTTRRSLPLEAMAKIVQPQNVESAALTVAIA